jgi:hypothetical protein
MFVPTVKEQRTLMIRRVDKRLIAGLNTASLENRKGGESSNASRIEGDILQNFSIT